MDIVYLVRQGQHNEELRYSLRSLVNLPHDRVWIVGYCPPFLEGIDFIPVASGGSPHLNTTRNLYTACRDPRISEMFYWFSDDLFIPSPVDEISVYHRGSARQQVLDSIARYGESSYIDDLTATLDWMEDIYGITDPLSYDLHYPLPTSKRAMAAALEIRKPDHIHAFHKRTFYGNLYGIGGTEAADPKIAYDLEAEPDPDGVVWSSMDYTFRHGRIGQIVRERFPDPSPWEIPVEAELTRRR